MILTPRENCRIVLRSDSRKVPILLRATRESRTTTLQTPRSPPGADPMASRSTPSAPPLSIGRYELSGRVGTGQTGMLFRARDSETQNFVAVQLIPSDAIDRAHFDRLNAEFQRALPLEHPNILRLLDFGRESSFVYLVA